MHLTSLLAGAQVEGARLGTGQDMTFAIPLGVFVALAIVFLFWLRSGHERAQRQTELRRQRQREEEQERSLVLQAHEPPPGTGDAGPR